jgi:glycosyltransferase involved in cell wall biosynthesis
MNKPLISIVSPVYGAENILKKLVAEIESSVKQLTDDYEIILVEDCGPDQSWQGIQQICQENKKVIGIQLSRNFGQQQALHAGLTEAKGEYILTLDCDLQDPPRLLHQMYEKALQGFDIVIGSRIVPKYGLIKRLSSNIFNWLMTKLTGFRHKKASANFVLYKRKALNALLSMSDYHIYFPTMVHWIGFNKTFVEFDHQEREDGKSAYSFRKRLNLAINTAISFSDKPLRYMVSIGFVMALLSFLAAMVLIVRYLFMDIQVAGWLSMFVSTFFLSGIIIFFLGVMGIYTGKIFQQAKNRPTFIINEKLNADE